MGYILVEGAGGPTILNTNEIYWINQAGDNCSRVHLKNLFKAKRDTRDDYITVFETAEEIYEKIIKGLP